MAEQRRKDPGRKQARGARRSQQGGRPVRAPRARHGGSHAPRTVIPSNRWRPMRRVGGGPPGNPGQPSPGERPTPAAAQQAEQAPPRHGVLGRLFSRHP